MKTELSLWRFAFGGPGQGAAELGHGRAVPPRGPGTWHVALASAVPVRWHITRSSYHAVCCAVSPVSSHCCKKSGTARCPLAGGLEKRVRARRPKWATYVAESQVSRHEHQSDALACSQCAPRHTVPCRGQSP